MSRVRAMVSVSSVASYAACTAMLLAVECDAAFSGSFWERANKDQAAWERANKDRNQEMRQDQAAFLGSFFLFVIVLALIFGLTSVIIAVCTANNCPSQSSGTTAVTVTTRRLSLGPLLPRGPAAPVDMNAPSRVTGSINFTGDATAGRGALNTQAHLNMRASAGPAAPRVGSCVVTTMQPTPQPTVFVQHRTLQPSPVIVQHSAPQPSAVVISAPQQPGISHVQPSIMPPNVHMHASAPPQFETQPQQAFMHMPHAEQQQHMMPHQQQPARRF